MTPRSLFNIVLKILGIFFIRDILAAIPALLTMILTNSVTESTGDNIWMILSTTMILFVYCFISYCLIFKSETIINKLKLDQGFDQDTIPLNMHRSTIISITIMVIGGLILVDQIPNFFRELYAYYEKRQIGFTLNKPTFSYVILILLFEIN